MLLGDVHGKVLIPERRGEDDLEPLLIELLQHAGHLGGLGDILDELGLSAHRLLEVLPCVIVLERPARVSHRADIDEGDFRLGLRGRGACHAGQQGQHQWDDPHANPVPHHFPLFAMERRRRQASLPGTSPEPAGAPDPPGQRIAGVAGV